MPYNTDIKIKSTMKRTMNLFLASYVNSESKALVLDAETLLSSNTLYNQGMKKENIIVINDNEDIIEKAKQQGFIHSKVGLTTNVLFQVNGCFDIIYLDYCGTPEKSKNGFNPSYDLLWAADRLKRNGIIVTTFSRRTQDAIEKANDIIPFTLTLAKEVNYCETVPMYSMIMTKINPRHARDTFNHLKRNLPVEVQTQETPKTKKVRRSRRNPQPRVVMNIMDKQSKFYI